MSGTRLSLTPAHLLRVGTGRDAIRVWARGHGLIIGSPGVLLVWRSLDGLFFHPAGKRCRALFIGFHGVAWVSIPLPPGARTAVPVVGALRPPELPALRALPSLRVHLTVTPPEYPEGLP